MSRNRSIVHGLLLRLALIFTLGPPVATLVLLAGFDQDAVDAINLVQERRADAVIANLHETQSGKLFVAHTLAANLKTLSAFRMAIYSARGGDSPALVWPAGTHLNSWDYENTYDTVRMRRGQSYRLVFFPGRSSLSSMSSWLLREIGTEIIPVLLILILISAPLMALTVRNHFAPIRQLVAEADAMRDSPGSARLSEEAAPLELMPLIRAINSSLDRISAGFDVQKRFAATIAHELRTPISILAARFEQQPDNAEGRAALAQLRKLSHLINQILTISEMSARSLKVSAEFDLVRTVRDMIAEEVPHAIAEAVTLEFDGPEHPVILRGSAAAVGTAVRNLVDNAVRHSPAGGVVSVRLSETPPILEVADQGDGVPDAKKERIFEPFWKNADSSGAGVGLAIVREMAALFGATVSVRDNVPKGAVFQVVFPNAAIPSAV